MRDLPLQTSCVHVEPHAEIRGAGQGTSALSIHGAGAGCGTKRKGVTIIIPSIEKCVHLQGLPQQIVQKKNKPNRY